MNYILQKTTVLAAVLLSSCVSVDEIAVEYQKTTLAKYSELPIEHFKDKMVIKDDALETEVVYTTRMGSQPNPSGDPYISLISNKSDEFMRAIVPKNGGDVIYQIYLSLESADWRHPYQINFGEALGSKSVTRIGVDASCTSSNCKNYEDATVTLTPSDLDKMIAYLEDGGLSLLPFRVKSQSGRDYDSALSLSELTAIRQALK
ncbi:MAG: hypothetical protein ABJG88_05930 [Litorimonas sp.]